MQRIVPHCKKFLNPGSSNSYTLVCSRNYSSSLHNYYLRKRRKWPVSPYRTQWLDNFASQQAIQSLKQSAKKSKTHLLAALVNSFATYEVPPTPRAYHLIIRILTQKPQNSNWDNQIEEVLDYIEKVEKFDTPECFFIHLIKFYGDNGMLDRAVELFFRMPRFRCDPSVESLNALLSVLCRREQGLEIVPQVLIKSRLMGIRIDESSFRVLIKALCRIGKVDYAFQLLNYMVDEGFSLDEEVCSLMLSAIYNQNDCNETEILGFLEDMRKLGFKPRRVDYCEVIRFLVKRGRGMGALCLMKQMKMDGITPDIVCYNLVLDGLVLEGELIKVEEVFDELLMLGLVPDIYTYNAYIKGLCKQNKLEEGIRMLGSMEELGCKPDSSTYNIIIKGLYEAGEWNWAKEFASEIRKKGMLMDSETHRFFSDS